MAVLGGVGVIIWAAGSVMPKHQSVSATPGNSDVSAYAKVTGFAQDCITTFLESKQGDESNLVHCITRPEAKLSVGASTFTNPIIEDAKQTYNGPDGLSTWTVTVSGFVNAGKKFNPKREFFTLPVAMFDDNARAIDIPRPADARKLGVDVKLDYRNTVNTDSDLGKASLGFVTSYLTGGKDFSQFTVNGFADLPIDPAPFNVENFQPAVDGDITSNAPGNGGGYESAEVHVVIRAFDKTNVNITREYAFALTVRNIEGGWRISALNKIPRIKTKTSDPNESQTPTSTSTTQSAPPKPTRS
ncbi:hypothetical protein [Mycobacteroides abscessus]